MADKMEREWTWETDYDNKAKMFSDFICGQIKLRHGEIHVGVSELGYHLMGFVQHLDDPRVIEDVSFTLEWCILDDPMPFEEREAALPDLYQRVERMNWRRTDSGAFILYNKGGTDEFRFPFKNMREEAGGYGYFRLTLRGMSGFEPHQTYLARYYEGDEDEEVLRKW